MRLSLLALGGAAVVGLALIGAQDEARAAGREDLRVKMVDECVFDLWKRPDQRESAATRCKCAASSAVKTLSAADIADEPFFGDGLTSTQSDALKASLQSCK
ncbi:hypothetical protein [Rhodobium gokarnense]|uniref:Uncharacterized protein n=1 Tax=Rhodobium gokarnense TaxID=364296 RepID=A0ABT3HFK2_9HYPH|nr:hypothetical protein [Rhodobium gokarnense]MCW2309178.1 hypothetical protein [Rhodobium gokarnense]